MVRGGVRGKVIGGFRLQKEVLQGGLRHGWGGLRPGLGVKSGWD